MTTGRKETAADGTKRSTKSGRGPAGETKEAAEVLRIRSAIQDHPMRRPQILLVLIAVSINAMDGFDILAVSFVATSISREWQLGPEQLGVVFSAGLLGMAIGALILSWLVDLIGRRRAVVICLFMVASGMVGGALSTSPEFFILSRILTGAGAGGMYTATSTLVFEYASKNRRELSIGFVILGYSVGTVVGGAVSVFLLSNFGWRSIFLFGGTLGAILIPIVLWKVPESLEFLMSRQPKNALARINRTLARLKIAPLTALPRSENPAEKVRKKSPLDIFQGNILLIATPIVFAKFLFMMTQYFILNWTPRLMTEAGFSEAGGISFSIALSLGGITGSGLVGFASARWGVRPVGILMAVMASASIVAFGLTPTHQPFLVAGILFIAGASIFAASTCIFTVSAAALPVHVRGTAVGLAGGAGRLGSMLGAYMGGLLLALGFDRWGLCLVLALPALGAAVLVNHIAMADRRRTLAAAPTPGVPQGSGVPQGQMASTAEK